MRCLFSDLQELTHDPLNFFLRKGETDEPLVKLRLGFSPTYLLTDPALIKLFLKSDEADFDKGRFIKKLEQIFGVTLLTLSGEDSRRRRALHNEYLASGVTRNFVPDISSHIRQFAAQHARGESFVGLFTMRPLALRLISSIIFGRNTLSRGDENALNEAEHFIEQDVADSFFQTLPDWPWVRAAKKRRLEFSRTAMRHIVEKVLSNKSSQGLVHKLAELGLSSGEIQNEVLMMLWGGHETTGSAMTWLLYLIATTPGLAAQLADEAESVMDGAGEIDPAKLPQAKLSLAAVRETLRLYPSFHWFSREAQRKTEFAGVKLKKGSSVIVSPWLFQRSPRFWEEPDAFRLNRSYGSPAYIPFGAGPRVCLGMSLAMLELQLLALEISAAFKVEVLSSVPAPPPHAVISMLPPEIRLRLTPRRSVQTGFSEARQAALAEEADA